MTRWAGLGLAVAVAAAGTGVVRAAGSADPGRKTVRTVHIGGAGHLGVSLDDPDGDQRGAVVRRVLEKTPAAAAGLKADDVIVAFDGEAVRSAAHLTRLIRETPAGRKVALTVLRGGARQELQATLDSNRYGRLNDLANLRIDGLDKLKILGIDKAMGVLDDLEIPEPPEPPEPSEPSEPPAAPEPPSPPGLPSFDHGAFDMVIGRPRLGIEISPLSEQLARYFKVEDGVLVTSVNDDSPAAKAGLRAGDVIVRVDGEAVTSSRDLVRRVARFGEGELTLSVQRDGQPLDVKVHLDARRPRRSGPTS